MNQENLQYLKDNIKYMGFGESLYPQLQNELAKGSPQFQLQLKTEIGGKAFSASLNFRKSDSRDMYFFNSYHASLERKDGVQKDQVFYLTKGRGVTAKEAYNLLDGRSVLKDLTTKEGKPFQAWLQLDFEKKDKHNNHEVKQIHENYGFNLKETVSKFAIGDLAYPDREAALLQSLQKGNLQAATFEKDGNQHRLFMEADPKYKGVNLYDTTLKMLPKEEVAKFKVESKEQGVKAEVKGEEKGKGKDIKKEVAPKKQKAEKKAGSDLLPKKTTRPKKGLGIA